MSNIKKEQRMKNIIYKNIFTSINCDDEETNNSVINLKMRKINNKPNNQNNSEKIQFELKKLLGDLHGTKFIHDKISKEKINRLKLTPYQKLLKQNAKEKKALSIKKNLYLNPRNLEYITNLNYFKNNKKPNMKSITNKTERSFHSYKKSFFEACKTQNNFNKTNYNKFLIKAMKLPISRNINSYKEKTICNLKIFKEDKRNFEKDWIILGQNRKININNIFSINSNKIMINCKPKNKININIYEHSVHSKSYSKINLKIPIIKKNKNNFNDYIKTNYTERNRDNLGALNFFNEPKINDYLYKKENSKKIIIN